MKTVIEMAREVGFTDGELSFITTMLERFAELVRADEREQIAQVIDDAPALVEFAKNEHGGCLMCGFTPKVAAAFIRARSNTCKS